MVTGARITSIISILLLATHGAQGQMKLPSAGAAHGERSELPLVTQLQPQASGVLQSFPDAPSAYLSTLNDKFHCLGNATAALDFPANRNVTKVNLEPPTLTLTSSSHPSGQDAVPRNEFDSFLKKYLYSSPLNIATYRSSTNGSLLSRSTDAASQLLITHNDSGERVLNVHYLLAALTSAAADTARQPYWAQSASGTFSDFGSNLGSDAGMNVFREFQPGFRKMLDSHSPKFVRRLERITSD